MSQEEKDIPNLESLDVNKVKEVIAVTTPIPAQDGTISKKTSVFHLPVYKISLQLEEDKNQPNIDFYCDLADLTDLISKLKTCRNCWR